MDYGLPTIDCCVYPQLELNIFVQKMNHE